jgi:Flp pilus assembly protein protease CpaA
VLDAIGTLVPLAVLGYAAYSDFRTREVDDAVWVVLCAASAPFVASKLIEMEKGALVAYALSAYLAFAAGFALSALGAWGWADFLALACIGLVALPREGALSLIPSLSTLINALLMSSAYPVLLFAENVSRLAKGERVFEGVEASAPLRALALFTLRYVPVQEYLKRKSFYSLAERVEGGKRRLVFKVGVGDETPAALPPADRVWVSPHVPFVTMLALGYALHVTVGCLLDHLLAPLPLR